MRAKEISHYAQKQNFLISTVVGLHIRPEDLPHSSPGVGHLGGNYRSHRDRQNALHCVTLAYGNAVVSRDYQSSGEAGRILAEEALLRTEVVAVEGHIAQVVAVERTVVLKVDVHMDFLEVDFPQVVADNVEMVVDDLLRKNLDVELHKAVVVEFHHMAVAVEILHTMPVGQL
jgi:hypothetical protein